MPEQFARRDKRNCGIDRRCRRRAGVGLALAVAWIPYASPAFGARATLDTSQITETDIAAALQRAYQLPTLIAASRSPSDENAIVERERTRLGQLLTEFGYLDAHMTSEQSGSGLILRPVLGRRFTVGSVQLKGVRQPELGPGDVAELAARARELVGQPATASAAGMFVRRVLDRVGERDFAFARLQAVKWTPTGSVTATASFDLEMGPRCHFGKVVFNGSRRGEANGLLDLVPFRDGDRYDRTKLERLRSNLSARKGVRSFNLDLERDETCKLTVRVRLREDPANAAVLNDSGFKGLGSGLAALAVLAVTQLAATIGAPRTMLRPLRLVSVVSVLTFAVTAMPRLVSFFS